MVSSTNNNFSVYGIWGQVADTPTPLTSAENMTITVEKGNAVSATHAGRGLVAGIYAQGDVESLSVNNYGTIAVTRGPQTIGTIATATTTSTTVNIPTVPNVTPTPTPTISSGNLGIAAAIYNNEEEVELEIIHNFRTGVIEATGQFTAAIYSRANALLIVNDEGGIIRNNSPDGGGVAISVNDGRIQDDGPEDATTPTVREVKYAKAFIDNSGEIDGDIQILDSNGLANMGARVAGIDPLLITSQTDRRDSVIDNSGAINGNIYLGAGNHILTNEASATIDGSIDVDQRRTFAAPINSTANPSLPFSISLAGKPSTEAGDDEDDESGTTYSTYADFLAANPEHHFEFDSAGVLTGNLTVRTATPGSGSMASTVELRTHITGSGTGSTLLHPSTNSGFIGGTLSIGKDGVTPNGQNITVSTIAQTTTLTPVIDLTVRNDETFLVARHLFGTDLPTVLETPSSLTGRGIR